MVTGYPISEAVNAAKITKHCNLPGYDKGISFAFAVLANRR